MVASGNVLNVDESVPSHDLGEVMHTSDGRVFRYAKAGTLALVAGNVLQASAEDTATQNLAVAAASIGATQVVTTTTVTVTANEYAGGFITVTVTPGLGRTYRIKQHAAYTAAAATFDLEDPIEVALTTVSRIDLVRNPYNGVIANPTTSTSTVVGVAVSPITASQYGWIQTRGMGNVTFDANGAHTVGNLVTVSRTTAGTARLAVGGTTEAFAPLGVLITGVANSENGSVMLNLA